MMKLRRPFALLTACAALACACKPAPDAPKAKTAPPPAAAASTPAPPPLTFKQETKDAEVALTIDPAIAAWPALARAIYDEETKLLKDFVVQASKDKADMAGQDMPDWTYASEADWRLSAKAGPLVSVRRLSYEFTGGAHPNHGWSDKLWNAQAGREIRTADLFVPGADMTALNTAICDAVKTAQVKRGVDPVDPTINNGIFSCPAWSDTAIVLAPSKTPDKAAGLTVLIGPYMVGSYAEGDYEVFVPAAKFADLLAPAWRDLFAGEASRAANADGTPTQQIKSE